ncbi:unnamed protein product [Tilletia controversa]|uniref:mRNA export factor GLE1 n=3 Tax=Tilletia TaxID=13289 RepID=A0A8X7MKT8_9BASI|nr:hypothetical protein CF336_g8598 [Tilletia laevis]KAE8182887.1 hypothetical protein CF328_g8365 [Tilletia controversa]KAE8240825.1 hypothetical protein A4X03_0g8322 [Tilletia caries]KAE8184175.1 hypothetical protein CF335_g8102 [Tilletia laevis]KAE8239182.1 hypothetical protein A4X06_0g8466 [Tilletia controversa]
MRISIHDLSDSEDEPIVVVPNITSVGDNESESDLLDSSQLAGLAHYSSAARQFFPKRAQSNPPARAPLSARDPRRTPSAEPSRNIKRAYTPYWTTAQPSPEELSKSFSAIGLEGTSDFEVVLSSPDSTDAAAVSSADELDDSADSEEERWPVNPRGYHPRRAVKGRAGNQKGRNARNAGVDEEVMRRIRLSALPESGRTSNAKENVWAVATSRYHAQARAFSQNRVTAAPGSGNATAFGLRKAPLASLKHRTPFGLSVVSEEASRQPSAAINEVQNLLRELHMRRDEDDKRLQNDFEARSKRLWDSIEASIREAEHKNEAEAAAQTAVLIAKRKEQEANERVAREAREAEERRVAEENERQRQVEEEAKRKEEEEARRREAEAEEERKREKAAAEADAASTLGGVAGPSLWTQARDDYEKWYSRIQDIKTNVLPQISDNPDWRKQCFMAKRQITPKISQLTNSRSEIIRITTSIADVLGQAKNAHPAIYTWILNHLSKCLIRQAEQEVAARSSTAFPLARVVVWLIFSGHEELGEVLMARLVKKCCYVVAYWPQKGKTQSDGEYRKQLGRPRPDETTHTFNSRMSGIFALYCAILQTLPTPPPTQTGGSLNLETMPACFRSNMLWTWQARAMTRPMTDHPLTPTLLATCFEVAGRRAQGYYGKQMSKLWRLLLVEGLRERKAGYVHRYLEAGAEDGGALAASSRLQLLLEEWEKTGVAKADPAADRMDP